MLDAANEIAEEVQRSRASAGMASASFRVGPLSPGRHPMVGFVLHRPLSGAADRSISSSPTDTTPQTRQSSQDEAHTDTRDQTSRSSSNLFIPTLQPAAIPAEYQSSLRNYPPPHPSHSGALAASPGPSGFQIPASAPQLQRTYSTSSEVGRVRPWPPSSNVSYPLSSPSDTSPTGHAWIERENIVHSSPMTVPGGSPAHGSPTRERAHHRYAPYLHSASLSQGGTSSPYPGYTSGQGSPSHPPSIRSADAAPYSGSRVFETAP